MNNLKTNQDRPCTLYGTRFNGVFSVSGVVHVIRTVEELPYFREGEILVAEKIEPAWADQLSLAKALIEDALTGESDAPGIADRYDIAATVNVPDALLHLRSGDIVTIYSNGEIERIPEQRAPDSPMRVSVPAAVNARSVSGIITASNVVAFNSKKQASNEDAANDAGNDESMGHDDSYSCGK